MCPQPAFKPLYPPDPTSPGAATNQAPILELCSATVLLRPSRPSPWATPFGPPRAKLATPLASSLPPLPPTHLSHASIVPPTPMTRLCRHAPPYRSDTRGWPASGNLSRILHHSLVSGDSLLLRRYPHCPLEPQLAGTPSPLLQVGATAEEPFLCASNRLSPPSVRHDPQVSLSSLDTLKWLLVGQCSRLVMLLAAQAAREMSGASPLLR
jgi:hypothetical protein